MGFAVSLNQLLHHVQKRLKCPSKDILLKNNLNTTGIPNLAYLFQIVIILDSLSQKTIILVSLSQNVGILDPLAQNSNVLAPLRKLKPHLLPISIPIPLCLR